MTAGQDLKMQDKQKYVKEILSPHFNWVVTLTGKAKKVKFSHTRYRALGPELIPVYRQSARR